LSILFSKIRRIHQTARPPDTLLVNHSVLHDLQEVLSRVRNRIEVFKWIAVEKDEVVWRSLFNDTWASREKIMGAESFNKCALPFVRRFRAS
jgi:hypothetical protein